MSLKHNFRKLAIWQEARKLVNETYLITSKFPKSEMYGLSNQLQRCAVSIASNIAEGSARNSDKHFVQYLETALGSSFEWETQLICAKDLEYMDDVIFEKNLKAIQKLQAMISNFKKTLN
ncbi:four helix bundle protein [Aequorivita soesokkakensis]|uniref:Four helix bundle protein n=1 Tax=Aequorivita soesokkakensis TaxID=1385699 RepID=A0A1A9LDU5_9FLAO|nr:four helix bundle protein [Aequorivita soesokkakensis]OAD90911.1 four helix bundle protein [Aequorivita soesokkakensis]